jgi:hypothetical protein
MIDRSTLLSWSRSRATKNMELGLKPPWGPCSLLPISEENLDIGVPLTLSWSRPGQVVTMSLSD